MTDPFARLEPYARLVLARALRAAGATGPADIGLRLGALAKFDRLIAALARLELPEPIGAEAARAAVLAEAPALAPHLALLDRCVERLADIVSGRVAATDVVFPGGRFDLVEALYRDNPWADHFNRLIADGVAQAVAALPPDETVRIIEIGAGTGGTTAGVLQALDSRGDRVRYDYTDISPGFVQHGRRRFGAGRPWVACSLLDIERSPAEQGFAEGGYHLAIATNVLHATRRIAATLDHVRRLLIPGGLLLVNEITRSGAFATLTFGLLDGWWAFADPEIRAPDAPVLSAAGWRRALLAAGFGAPAVFGWDDAPEDSFQCLLVAEAGDPPAASAPAGLPAWVEAVLTERLSEVLGLAVDEVPRDRPFAELGVDSIVAPQLVDAANEVLDAGLVTTDVFNYATIAALTERVVATAAPAVALARDRGAAPTAAVRDQPAPGSTVPGPPASVAQSDIAVIGLACRFPGANDVEALWDRLVAGDCMVSEVPPERWDWRPLFDPVRRPGRIYARWGGFLDGHDRFDPEFFNLSYREARLMSPQQRVFLETAWHALEDSGYGPRSVSGLDCGVFVGVTHQSYAPETGDSSGALGNSVAILPARLSYLLNLKGPSLPIDTACSSSLVAVHMACRSLLAGDADMALAGGVSVLLSDPKLHLFLSDSGMASPTGACRAFAAGADGFVPGEGVGVVVLKRLDRALADGDRVIGVIKGSGVNQDGKTSGIMAPSGPAQTALVTAIYRRAGIDPRSIGLVEAHGTGTELGDPIEVGALTEAFRQSTDAVGFCALGSIKSNIGHTLAAAGIAGLFKALLALDRECIPPSLHFDRPNPHIDFAASPFFAATSAIAWPRTAEAPRRAAVSSFGFSGTNAHLVLEEAPVPRHRTIPAREWPVLLSARSPEALARLVAAMAGALEAGAPELADIAFTLAAGRGHFEYRLALVAADLRGLRTGLAGAGQRWQGGPVAAPSRAEAEAALAALLQGGVAAPARIAELYARGADGAWERLFAGVQVRRIRLPGYPFARERFWLEERTPSAHPLLGTQSSQGRWPLLLDPAAFPLADHRFEGRPLLPAAAALDLLREAAARSGLTLPLALEEVRFQAPLFAAAPAGAALVNIGGGARIVGGDRDALRHVEARFAAASPALATATPAALAARLGPVRPGADLYDQFRRLGFEYGSSFRVIEQWASDGKEVIARLVAGRPAPDGWVLDPGLLDGAMQAAIGLALAGEGLPSGTVIPIGVRRFTIYGTLGGACFAHVRRNGDTSLTIRLVDDTGTVLAVLEDLEIRLEAAKDEINFYEPVWIAVPPANRPIGRPAVLLDADEVLWHALDRQPVLVLPGDGFVREGPRRYRLRPDSADDHGRLVAALLADQVGLDPIWHCRRDTELWPLLHLVRALLDQARGRPIRLLHAGTDHAIAAAVAGLARALAEEQSMLRLSSVVLPELSAEILAAEDGTAAVGYAGGIRRVPRHRRLDPAPVAPILRRRGTYLISGGLGAIGQAVARHLARAWQANVVLLGRRPAAPPGLIAQIEAAGGAGLYCPADVTRPEALAAALVAIRDRFGPLHGVIHAAGIQRDGILRGKPESAIAEVLDAKIAGVRALDQATSSEPLDFFALFSSLAGSFGVAGQADYAAANAFLDACATRRTGPGRTVSIGWPYWREGGMAADGVAETRAAETGVRPLDTAAGLAAFEAALGLGRPHVLVLPGVPDAVARFLADQAEVGPGRSGAAARIHRAPSTEEVPVGAALAYVTGIFARATGMPASRLRPDRPMEQYGVDSIMVMKITAELERDLGPLPKTLLFDHADLASLSGHLATRYGAGLPIAAPGAAAPAMAAASDGIAIIGIAGRFPEADSLDEFWANLVAGRDCIREIPPERWDHARHYDPTPGVPGKSYAKWGGFLRDVARFDPLFFNIAPREAERMDPQERLFLEICWEALEDSGYTARDLPGDAARSAGVFAGVMYGDYQLKALDQQARGNPVLAASPYWSIANRVSFVLDLRGPSLAVDTACSSSLSAIHLACQTLSAGECRVAIAGGVNLSLHPMKYLGLSQGRFASTDGRCRSFAEGGDGYVPGEGVGAVILKPLAAALADGDHIHAVIRGWAANHGGKTNGYTVPSPSRQAEVVAAALRRAGVGAESIGYVEAHGTGTALGDPIEIAGLTAAFGPTMARGSCPIGSAKTAIGHLEAAAGIAGLAKLVLQLRHRTLPSSGLDGAPNPNIDFAASPFRLLSAAEPWIGPLPLRAGISAFGAGGANAHLVVEAIERAPAAAGHGRCALVLSARTLEQLDAYAARLVPFLRSADHSLPDICRTLQIGREPMAARLGFVCATKEEAADRLDAFLAGRGPKAHLAGDDDEPAPAPPSDAPLDALTAAWVLGAPVDWRALPHPGRRVPVPPRPFLGARYWIPETEASPGTGRLGEAGGQAPVRGEVSNRVLDASIPSLDGAVFVKRWHPLDPLVADHRVAGRALLPGAALLEMALAAAEQAGIARPSASDIVWRRPVEVPADGVRLTIRLRREDGRVRFTITGNDGEHAGGLLRSDDRPPLPALDLERSRRGARPGPDATAIYRRLAALGLDYGPGLALLERIELGTDSVIGTLAPSARPGGMAERIDAAFQALIGFAADGSGSLMIPFALAGARSLGDPAAARYVAATRRAETMFDLVLADADGTVVGEFDGLAVRPVGNAAVPLRFCRPVWRSAPLPAPADPGRVRVVRESSDPAALIEAAEACDTLIWQAVPEETEAQALALLRAIRVLDGTGRLQRPLRLVVATRGLHGVVPGDAIDPSAGGLVGVARVLALEYPSVGVALVDLDAAAAARPDVIELLAAEPAASPCREIAWRGGERRQLGLEAMPAPGPAVPPDYEVWMIVGGAGGIGRAFAETLARQGARVALVGRRPSAALPPLPEAGPGEIRYVQADAGDRVALAAAVERIRGWWGGIDAAVHSALVLDDRPLRRMEDAAFRAAFRPKAALATLEAVLADEPRLALLLLFSSANVYAGVPGQANYVAGSRYADALAQAIAQRRTWRVVTIDWGLWGEIGAVSDETHRLRLERAGVYPILPAEGMAAIAQVLGAGADQVAVIKADDTALAALGLVPPSRPAVASLQSLAPPAATDKITAGFAALERYGRLRLRLILETMAASPLDKAYTPAGIVKRLGIDPRHRRLFEALLAALERDGLAEQRDGLWRFAPTVGTPIGPDLDETAGARRLLDACLAAYPDLLRGRRDPLDVIFPAGSLDLVAGSYAGNPLSDHLNVAIAEAIRAEVSARIARSPEGRLRLLEAGAGTGGTSEAVLPALVPWRERIDYLYTDLSQRFLAHGAARFGAAHPFLRTALYDVERPCEASGLEPGSVDIVLASNVLHATSSLAGTLAGLARLLRPGGLLVIGEVTAVQDYATLVFGLTAGWWRAEDPESRLAGAPLADVPSWRRLLAAAGFGSLHAYAPPGVAQTVLLAYREGSEAEAAPVPLSPAAAPRPPAQPLGTDLADWLRGIFADVLRLDPAEIRLNETFDRYGLESLTAVDIRNRVEERIPGLPATLLFEHNSLRALVEYLQSIAPARTEGSAGGTVGGGPRATSGAANIRPEAVPLVSDAAEPIAIIGFAGRFPGGPDPESFWRLLREGGSAIAEVPPERFDMKRWFDPAGGEGSSYARWAGLIDGVDCFDPLFFNLSPLEAETMDPQERLFLETAWHAMENSGCTPARLKAGAGGIPDVGVFVGVMNTGYQWLAAEAWQGGHANAASTHYWSIANRLSYVCDFNGPSLAVDTACSASLTALHLACESLRRRECAAAIAGGVNLLLHPRQLVNLAQARMLSRDDRCRAFGAGADGFVDGEGVGAVLLKPLAAAIADGDRVEAVIRGSAVNAGGRTSGFTVPSPKAQAAVVRAALARAGIPPESISYVEAHGTGTALGDPIEIAGLAEALAGERPARCVIGALKANIGHLESAAGIAGVIKVLLQFRHRELAPSPYAATPNPLIDFAATPFELAGAAQAWRDPGPWPLRAGISAFGAGGANAHIVLEAPAGSLPDPVPDALVVIPLSARDAERLAELAGRLRDAVVADPAADLASIAYTLQVGRVALKQRVVIRAATRAELIAALAALASGSGGEDRGLLRGAGASAAAAMFSETEEGRLALDALLARADLDRLARLWVEGVEVRWADLPGYAVRRPRILALPGYPFARERYWLPTPAVPAVAVVVPSPPAEPTGMLRLLTREWSEAAPAGGLAQGVLAVLARDPATAAGFASAWPGQRVVLPGPDAAAERVAALLADPAAMPVTLVQALGWETDGDPPEAGILATLDLVRTAESAGPAAFRLLHLHRTDPGAVRPFEAAAAAFLRSALTERPSRSVRAVTIEGACSLDEAARLCLAEAADRTTVPEVHYRGGRRLVPKLAVLPADPGRSDGIGFRVGGSYLLAGGLGEVGFALAERMAQRYHARIAILGRAAAETVRDRIGALAALGGEVHYASCDLADPTRLEAALAELRREAGPFHGVIHLARAVEDGLIGCKSADSFRRVMAPKIAGTAALDRALGMEALDWFVLCSSLAAWFGLAGGSDYAYACAWQGHFARQRQLLVEQGRRQGRTVAIAWPQWRYDRMLRAERRGEIDRLGLKLLGADDGLRLIELALGHGSADIAAVKASAAGLATIVAGYGGAVEPPRADIESEVAALDDVALERYVAYLSAQAEGGQSGGVAAIIRQEFCSYLRIAPDAVLPTSRFADFGLDSIKALTIAERLQHRLDVPVDPAMLYEHPTIEALAAALDPDGALAEAGQ
jgi:acyl transferase domain-containing protein/SAM-dependent methyltransferase/aryl carrier-like protein